jgi:hypothetical protein
VPCLYLVPQSSGLGWHTPAFKWNLSPDPVLICHNPIVLHFPAANAPIPATMVSSTSILSKRTPYLTGKAIHHPQARSLRRISQLSHLPTPKLSRYGLHIVAFRGNTDESVIVPLDAFQVLQVNRAASKDTCVRAYDKLVNTIPEAGFSQVRKIRRMWSLERTTIVRNFLTYNCYGSINCIRMQRPKTLITL